MTKECDVLVVGAGASGATAAVSLVKRGCKVIIVEKTSHIGEHTGVKFDITEESHLDEIIAELNLPVYGKTNKTKWFSQHHTLSLNSHIHDLYFKRGSSSDCYDVQVMDDVLNEGATLLNDTVIHRIEPHEVTIKTKNNTDVIHPKIIIAADGHNSFVYEMLSSQVHLQDITSIEGYGVVGNDFDLPPGVTHIFFDAEMAPGGYLYLGKTHQGDGVACVVVDGSVTAAPLESYFRQFVASNELLQSTLEPATMTSTFQGLSKTGILKRRRYGNVLLVGDAAGMVEPFSGEGIAASMLSGVAAGQTIHTCLEQQRWDKEHLMMYEQQWKNQPYGDVTLGENMEIMQQVNLQIQEFFSQKTLTSQAKKEFIEFVNTLT